MNLSRHRFCRTNFAVNVVLPVVVLALTPIGSSPIFGQTAFPPPQNSEIPISESSSYRRLALRDVAHVPFEAFVSQDKTDWVFGKLSPDYPGVRQISASLASKGKPFHSSSPYKSGELVMVPLTRSGMPLESVKYKVAFPFTFSTSDADRHVVMSPFIVGGYAVFQYKSDEIEQNRYSQVHAVPASQIKSVAPAFAFFRDNPALWDEKRQTDRGGVSGADRAAARLVQALDDPNPLIAAWSCRRLLQTGKLPSGAAEKLLQASEKADDPLRVALMADTLLEFSDEKARPEVVALIAKRVEAAPTLTALHGLLLGAWSGGVAQSVDAEGNRSAPPLALKANVRRRYLTRNTVAGASALTTAQKPNADEEAVLGILKTYGLGTQ